MLKSLVPAGVQGFLLPELIPPAELILNYDPAFRGTGNGPICMWGLGGPR